MPLPVGALAAIGARVAGKLAWHYGRRAAAKWAARAGAVGVGGYLGYKAGQRVKRIGKSSTIGSAMPRRIGAKRVRGIGSRARRARRQPSARGAFKRRASVNYARPLKRRRGVRPTARKYRASGVSGAYTGAVKLKYKRAKVSIFEKSGASHCNETHGSQHMAHCNWIGFQNCRPYELGRVIGIALCRWIYRKYYGHEFQSVTDKLLMYLTTSTWGVQPTLIALVWQQTAGGASTTGLSTTDVYNVTTTSTPQDFGTWFANNVWSDGNYGNRVPNRVLKYIAISETIGNNSVPGVYGKYIPVDKMMLSCYSYATINIQNSTASDNNSTSTDVVDANPLCGKVYKINGFAVLPKVVTSTGEQTVAGAVTLVGMTDIWPQLSQTTVTGTTLPAGPTAGTAPNDYVVPPAQYQLPLPPSHFEKCRGAASVSFEPGETKTFRMAWKFTGLLSTLIAYVYEADGGSTGSVQSFPSKTRRSIGSTLLFALEKRIKGGLRTSGGEPVPIIVNYHADHYAGAVIKGIGKSIMMRENISLEDDNPNAV